MSDDHKKAAGDAAMAYVKPGMKVGLGTGSTAAWFVKAIAASGLKLTLASTSQQTTTMAEALGLQIRAIDDLGTLDLVVDGADEVGPGLSLIESGGGAGLLREKPDLGAGQNPRRHRRCPRQRPWRHSASSRCRSEIEAFAYKGTVNRICDVLAEFDINTVPMVRKRDGGNWISDGGNLIFDIACGAITDPSGLAAGVAGSRSPAWSITGSSSTWPRWR